MFIFNKSVFSGISTVIYTLILCTSSYLSSAFATDYSVVAGSQVLLKTVNSPLAPTNIGSNSLLLSSNSMLSVPLLGGYTTATGNVQQDAANNLCASLIGPYPTGGLNNRNNLLFAPNSEEWGNKLAIVEGYMWIYVSKNIPLGTYPLDGVYVSQGPAFSNYASISLTLLGDTLTVRSPPCTIATQTTINFDTTSPEGRKISAPITYQCGEIENTTVLDAYLIASAVGSTTLPSATELALASAGGSHPGGVVRGYAGQGVDTGSADCVDTTNSLSFNGEFNTRLAPVTNGLALQIPLIWQLCLQGNETLA